MKIPENRSAFYFPGVSGQKGRRPRIIPLSILFLVYLFSGLFSPARADETRVFLPKWETEHERNLGATQVFKSSWFRNNHPELYGITEPPTQPVSFYAEFEPVDAIYYVWFAGWYNNFFWEITNYIATYEPGVEIKLLVEGESHESSIKSLISSYGGDPDHPEYIDLSGWPYHGQNPLDSIWTVDSGPFWITDGGGNLASADLRYYFHRVNDDAIPAKLADLMGTSTYRPDLDLEGGNLMTDGQGMCFATYKPAMVNLPRKLLEIEDAMAMYLGCEKMIWLRRLIAEGTGHVDMFSRILDPTTIIVGEYDPAEDPGNAEILNYNAALLASETNLNGDPLDVHRIPMPSNNNRQVWRTYTNSVMVNDLVLVPTYAQETTHEAQALAVYENLLPGKTVIGIDSDSIITSGGAIHCVTRTRPVATHAIIDEDPPYLCEGDWNCVTGCGEYDYTGDCLFNHSVYCSDGSDIVVENCSNRGRMCGWDFDNDYVHCVNQGCYEAPAEGICKTVEGATFAIWCENDYPLLERCEPHMFCHMDESLGRTACQICDNKCVMGETGCSEDGRFEWVCGDDPEGTPCLEQLMTDCDDTEACLDGEDGCVQVCEHECNAGETGCSENLQAVWTCGLLDDGDLCRDRIYSYCAVGEHCQNGVCVDGCVDECEKDEKGCSDDKQSRWVCGEAGDGDDCLERVFHHCGENRHCADGKCVDGCADACSPGDTGCSQDSQSRWTCSESVDEHGCLYRVYEHCGADSHCRDGRCIGGCADACRPGERGCASETASWECGHDGQSDCLVRMETECEPGDICMLGECGPKPLLGGSRAGCGCRSAHSPGGNGPLFFLFLMTGVLLPALKRRKQLPASKHR